MKILACDTETTGLDPKKDRITEIGLVLYDGELRVPFGDRLFAAPLSCLWG